jgi:tetratricopeptide (TPR) repeat protein
VRAPLLGQPLCLLAFAALLGCVRTRFEPPHAGEDDRAERLYRESRFAEAYAAYRQHIEKDGPSPELEYNAGNSLYRMGHATEAIGSFRQALEASAESVSASKPESDVRLRSLYNIGNAYARRAEAEDYKYESLKSAVRAYEDALVLDPADSDAKWNLELLLRKLSLPGYGPRTMATRGGAQWRGGNLTKAGYPGSETGYGAATGGGYGASQGESVRRMTESEARQMLQTARREQSRSGVSLNEDSAPQKSRGKPDW